VRDQAALSLGQMDSGAGIRLLAETCSGGRGPSVRALALIQDMAPDRLDQVPGPLRRQITYELARIRFWRNWPRTRSVTAAGAIGGAAGFALGLAPLMILHQSQITGSSIPDMLFIAPLLAVFGLLAGAVLALGISAGESLLSDRPGLGRLLGGTLLGGVGFTLLVSLPLSAIAPASLREAALTVAGGGLFAALIGLGITLPAAIHPGRGLVWAGGGLGAALGVVVWGMLGFDPFQVAPKPSVPPPVLLAFGGLAGLLIAFSIAWRGFFRARA
jgi:hypothetical protein